MAKTDDRLALDEQAASEAAPVLTEAERHDPESADAYVRRGMRFAEQNDLERAVQNYDRALEIDPEHADAYYRRGGAFLRLKEWAKAKADLAAARKYGSENMRIIDRIKRDHARAWKVLG